MKIEYDESKNIITISTPWGNQLEVTGYSESIILSDKNRNKIIMDKGGITFESDKDIALKARGNVKIKGLNIDIAAQVGLKAKANASAELSASGQTTVKGAIVMIN